MADEPRGTVQPTLPGESGVQEKLEKDGPIQSQEIEKDTNQSSLPVENGLPSINEELAKIFPESAHKFLKEKSSGKRGRPRKHPEKSVQKIKSGRGRSRKEVDTSEPSTQPGVSIKIGKVGRPKKGSEMSVEYPGKEIDTENQQKEQALENSMEKEKLRKRPRLSYVDTYIEDDEEEESESNDEYEDYLKHKDHNNEKTGVVDHKESNEGERDFMRLKESNEEQGGDMKRKKNNEKRVYMEPKECDENEGDDIKHEETNDEQEDDEVEDESNDVSEASLECDSSDESESGFESDKPAYPQGTKDKRRKKMDYLDEELPAYRIMKGTSGNQAGLSRYQILKVRLLKFQATKGRGRPSNKIKIAGTKRGRGRPRKNEMKTRTLKVNLEPLPELSIYSMPGIVKGHQSEGQGQSYLLSQGSTVKRKRGRPPKVSAETEAVLTNGQGSSGQTIGQGSSGQIQEEEQACSSNMSMKYEDHSSSQNDSSCGQTCDESESKRDGKKKKKKNGRSRRDSISKMTNVSVSIERLENVFDLKSLKDTQNIRLKQEKYETNVPEKDNDKIDIKQDVSDTVTDKAETVIDSMTDEQDLEGGTIATKHTEGRTAYTSEVVEGRITDTSQDDEDKLAETEQNVEDRLTDTQNYYLNQELSPKKKRGRPPKLNHLKVPVTVERPLDSHYIKKGRGRRKKNLKDPTQSCTQISTLKTYPSGKARGRPKGRKNKQLEYERLIEDIEIKEVFSKSKLDENRKADFNDDNHAGTSQSYNKLSEFALSKRCPSANYKQQHSVKDSNDIMDYFSNFDKESYPLSPQDIFDFNDTDLDNVGKTTETNQTVSCLVETGCKNLTSDPLPVVPDFNTNDSNPQPDGNGSKGKDSVPLFAGSGSKRIKIDRSLSGTKSEAKKSQSKSDEISPEYCSVPESTPDDTDFHTSPRKKSNCYKTLKQASYKKKNLSDDDVNKLPAAGSSTRLEAFIDSDQHLFVNRNQLNMTQQNFSGGLLDFHAPADPDFIDDDYLLAF